MDALHRGRLRQFHGPLSVNRIVPEATFVHGTVGELNAAASFPPPQTEHAVVRLSVRIGRRPAPFHGVVHPAAVVREAVRGLQDPRTVPLAVLPLAVVDGTVRPPKDAATAHGPFPPRARIGAAVGQDVGAHAVAQIFLEFTFVPTVGRGGWRTRALFLFAATLLFTTGLLLSVVV